MILTLPDFKDRRCLQLDFCGRIDGQVSIPELDKALVAEFSGPGKELFLGIVLPFPGDRKHTHVHLRLATSEAFDKKPPNVTATLDDIFKLVEPFMGKSTKTELDGVFVAELTEISPLIRSGFVETTVEKVQVRMTGGTLSVQGTPIHTIGWKLKKSGKVEFLLEARTERALTASYLVDGLHLMESAFKAMVVGGASE